LQDRANPVQMCVPYRWLKSVIGSKCSATSLWRVLAAMPLSHSWGVFPSVPSLRRTVSQSDIGKFYFRTSNEDHFSGQPVHEAARTENMSELHHIGEKDTKHLDFPLKQAPLRNRDSCKYSNDFAAKPLGERPCY